MIKALINGKWEFVPDKHLQIGGVSFAYKSGLYETFRTLNYKPVFLSPHMDRLYQTARKTNLTIQFSRSKLLDMVSTVIAEFSNPDQRVRILAVPDHLILYTSSLNIDSSIYDGVKVITVHASRNIPDIKTTNYQVCLSAWEKAQELHCFEAILTDRNGEIFEGSRSNIFWIKNEKLFTRQGKILPGITRQIIISNSSYPVEFGNLNVADFKIINELFITNSGSGVVPVSHVNGSRIGNGAVGEITRNLLNDYTKWIKEDIENLHP